LTFEDLADISMSQSLLLHAPYLSQSKRAAYDLKNDASLE